jgi:ankyrin repeat protein
MKALGPCIVEPGTPAQLEEARRERKRQIVDLLLSKGADVAQSDKYGMTALHMAVTAYDDEGYLARLTSRLLKRGAPPDPATRYGVTPLMLATERRRQRIVRILLDAGASPTARMQTGETPLSIARAQGDRAITSLLESVALPDAGGD